MFIVVAGGLSSVELHVSVYDISFLCQVNLLVLAQVAKSELLVAVKGRERSGRERSTIPSSDKGRERSTIPSLYAQRLFMDHENNVAKCVEELGCTKSYRMSKRGSRESKCQIWPWFPNHSCWSL